MLFMTCSRIGWNVSDTGRPFDDVLCQMCDLIKPASLRSGLAVPVGAA